MVQYLNRMHRKFPNALIVTNFGYKYASSQMMSWRSIFDVRNGEDGVIFAIDEIHSEYSSAAWKDFPEELLSEISQQRKQRVKIVCTSQVYGRIAKPIREQCFTVVQCKTFLHRWTFTKEYDAYDYEKHGGMTKDNVRLHALKKMSFIQSDFLRSCFDTFEKIKRLEKAEFLTRSEKGTSPP
jgi:ATP-dependent Clp protease ATP-binding subunit ClpX